MAPTRRDLLKGFASAALLSAAYHPSVLNGLLRVSPAAAQDLPALSPGLGRGTSVAVVGAGVAGLTTAYELAQAGFDVTVYEGQKRYGGRSLTVRPADADYRAWFLGENRFVRADSYCDFIPAEVRGAKVGEQTARFVPYPARRGDGYVDLAFDAGPGRIPTHHTGVLHYCRTFDVPMVPYIFVAETNLLQAGGFNGGAPVQFRHLRYDLHGYVAQMLYGTAEQAVGKNAALDPGAAERLRQMLVLFGDLSPQGSYRGSPREGFVVAPGAGTNSGVRREPLALEEILQARTLWPALFARADEDWQMPLLQPVGGMDMVWQAFLARRVGEADLRDRVRLSHAVTGLRYAGEDRGKVIVGYSRPGEAPGESTHDYVVMTGAPAAMAEIDATGVFAEGIEAMLRAVLYYGGGKYGVQTRSRFWEEDDLQIFGGISWTDRLSSQIWYPSDDYGSPTGILTTAYPQNTWSTDLDGNSYRADTDCRVPVPPKDLPPPALRGWRWAQMDHAGRTEAMLAGMAALHPGSRQHLHEETGLSISWENQPFQHGIDATHLPVSRPDDYARLIRAVDPAGRVYLAGDYLSYLWGWQEGAVRSAWWTLGLVRDHVLSQRG